MEAKRIGGDVGLFTGSAQCLMGLLGEILKWSLIFSFNLNLLKKMTKIYKKIKYKIKHYKKKIDHFVFFYESLPH
jgi:hypothetical protein